MQFQVPQFIDTEAKIVGPLTLKQFITLAAAGGVSVLFFYLFQFWLWILVTLVLGGVAVAIAFVKVNGRPFMLLIGSMFRYFWQPKFFLWKQAESRFPGAQLPELPSLARPGGSLLQGLMTKITTTTETISKREFSRALSLLKSEPAKEKVETLRRTTGEREAARRVDYR